MSFRRRLKGKQPPEGWELIEEVIEDFEHQMKEAVNEDTSAKRRNETTWKVTRIHWEKNRFIYDLMYNRKVMSRELYDWLVREKIADGALIAKWRKPGYEILCSLLAIQKGNHNFGTTSHCRVPMKQRAQQQRITPDVQTGCICCASGDGRFGGPIWWNTPLEETDETAEQNRAVWGQGEEPEQQQQYDDGPGPSRKRPLDEDEEGMDDEVKKRLAALKG
ncbi:G10 family [Micractinium conductrix]|uniref:G10 family n=1 Tax=Micractinium conductrix TaxID=554055 RepID=A0A2P6VAE4_9CHLO|nr:G10 family [Micractinium conductrix]|eukprot:PSC71064.1 G10 family [Micractinium conductrix]